MGLLRRSWHLPGIGGKAEPSPSSPRTGSFGRTRVIEELEGEPRPLLLPPLSVPKASQGEGCGASSRATQPSSTFQRGVQSAGERGVASSNSPKLSKLLKRCTARLNVDFVINTSVKTGFISQWQRKG